ADIAVGNILGSNIFNICGILGTTALIAPPTVREQVLWFDGPVMLLLAVALIPILFTGGRISRAEGAALVASMVAYMLSLFFLAPRWFPAPPPDDSEPPAQVIERPAAGDIPVE